MSNLSQFAGGSPVGSQVLMSDLGPTVTLADNSIWMRAGTLTSAASVPQLATLPQYKVIAGITSTITAQSSYNASLGYKMASNGAGIIIAVNGASGAILKSTDSGATWVRQDNTSTTGLYASTYYNDIVYANGKFVMVGQYSSANFIISWSTNGLAWTTVNITNPADWTGTTTTIAPYNNACAIVWTGTYFVAAIVYQEAYSSTRAIFVANLGAAATSAAAVVRAGSGAGMGDSYFDSYATSVTMSSNGAGGLVVSTPTYTSFTIGKFAYSADHGATWTLYTIPTGYVTTGCATLVGTKVFVTGSTNNTSLYVYNTPASVPTIIPNVAASELLFAGSNAGYAAGMKVFAYKSTLGQILEFDTTTYTTIVSTKQLLGTIGGANSPGNYSSNYTQYIDGKFITVGTELGISAARSYTSNFDNIVYYGITKQFGTNNNQYYVRIS